MFSVVYMSRVVRKPAFCICKNKDVDQLRGNREADQRLCFRYIDSTIPLLPKPKFQASSHLLWLYSLVCVGPGWKSRRPVFSQRFSYIPSSLYNNIHHEKFYLYTTWPLLSGFYGGHRFPFSLIQQTFHGEEFVMTMMDSSLIYC